MEEVGDEPLFCKRAAGIDIGKATVMVTVRVPSETRRGGRQQETREFGATRRELLALADWLRCHGVGRPGNGPRYPGTTGSRSSTGWKQRASSACWPTRNRSGTARPAEAGPVGLAVAGV
jgi:hypothetical protein